MKVCPFCQEQVNDGAIKCRHCGSTLVAIKGDEAQQAAEGDKTTVTYVFDSDLVRFLKIALATLAVFVVVGAFLFGYKLEDAVKELLKAQRDIEAAKADLGSARKDLDEAKGAVRALKDEVTVLLTEAKRELSSISSLNIESQLIVAEIRGRSRDLTVGERQSLAELRQVQPEKFRSAGALKLWPVGAVVRMAFIGGTDAAREEVERVAKRWTEYANLKFVFGDARDSDVRIKLNDIGNAQNWSYLGTDCLGIPKGEPTMALSVQGMSDAERRVAVLREFGHVLGLINEMMNPTVSIRWNKEVVYRHFADQGFTRKVVDANFFTVVPRASLPNYRDFDPASVMMKPIPASFTANGQEILAPTDLSASDKLLAAKLYPPQ